MTDALGAGPVRDDCAQVERDNLELHQALAEAIRRLRQANRLLPDGSERETRDIIAVFDRTSRPGAGV